MPRALRKYGLLLLLGASVLFPFVFYSSEFSARSELSLAERALRTLAAPLEALVSSAVHLVSGTWHEGKELFEARSKTAQITQENAKLRAEIHLLSQVRAEAQRLERLLEFKTTSQLEMLAARVQGGDPSFLFKNVRVDRGEADGVFPGMAVVAPEGVVGTVMRTGRSSSDVLLVTDPNSSVDVLIARNRRRGILEGTTQDSKLVFKFLDKGSTAQLGDEVMTSGLTGAFPRGIPLGIVTELGMESDGVTPRVLVRPTVNFEDLSASLILLRPSRELEVVRKVGGADWTKRVFSEGAPKSG